MDMKRIDAALDAYKSRLDEGDYDRLEFFRGLWQIQEQHGELVAKIVEYPIPNSEITENWYWQERPIFQESPITVNKDLFVATLEDISCYLVDNAGFDKEINEQLRFFDWRGLVEETNISLAGSDPMAYAQEFCGLAKDKSGLVLQPKTTIIVLGYAMRPMLEHASAALMKSLESALKKGNTIHDKPIFCPVCGGETTAAYVGETPSNQGNGRALYCSTCGNVWEFERIRCAHCGTRNQKHLHYYHIEGDDAHRLQTCDECGEYTRTVFRENLELPFAFEVEDLVMTPLDVIANESLFDLIKDSEE